ncbi:SGNH/GDSL hydrolase family protein [Streptomyces sp. M19]
MLSDCPEASWSTGTEVDSLAERLLPANARSGAGARSWNYAKTGARMADLPGQISTAVAKKPQLVTVLMGANDACRDSVDQMTSPPTTAPTSPPRSRTCAPRCPARRCTSPASGPQAAVVPRAFEPDRTDRLEAGDLPSMLKDASSDDAASDKRRQQVADRVDAYNGILKDVCGKDALCRYDSAVHDYRFTTDELSTWDWFHPSKEGQRRLAAMAYRTITRTDPARRPQRRAGRPAAPLSP